MKINIKIFVLYYLVSILFIFTNLNAKSRYNIKVGMNYSSFIEEKRNLEPGILFGIGKEWRIVKNTAIICDITFLTQKAILKNKTIGSSDTSFVESDIAVNNIHFSIKTFEIPIILRQYISLKKKYKASDTSWFPF